MPLSITCGGMTPSDLHEHYWTAGSSSKNNEAARAPGVVGTFGVGAIANFGIADSLTVETESAATGERTICRAEKSKLSLKDDCIERELLNSEGQPGATIIAHIPSDSHTNVRRARNYISEFVSLVEVPVFVNGELVSQRPIDDAVPAVPETWRANRKSEKLAERLTADVELILSNNADIWLKLTQIVWAGKPLPLTLLSNTNLRPARRAAFQQKGLNSAATY